MESQSGLAAEAEYRRSRGQRRRKIARRTRKGDSGGGQTGATWRYALAESNVPNEKPLGDGRAQRRSIRDESGCRWAGSLDGRKIIK